MKLPLVPSSTRILREIRNSALREFAALKIPGSVGKEITLHFFEDCILAFFNKGVYVEGQGLTWKSFALYSKDRGKTWKEYKDQFEPKEGFHKAIQYDPFTETFPTKTW